MTPLPSVAVEIVVGMLLIASGLLAMIAGLGVVRLAGFFQRMHAPALAGTLGTWCAALATVIWFSASGSRLALYPWLIVVLMSITSPITATVLGRAGLFRKRAARNAPAAPFGRGSDPS